MLRDIADYFRAQAQGRQPPRRKRKRPPVNTYGPASWTRPAHLMPPRERLTARELLRGAACGVRTFAGARLRGARLAGVDLSAVDLSHADLSHATLSGAALAGADLTRCQMRGAALDRADLHGAYLTRADLRGAHLTGADMRGADLRGALLAGADLSGANMREAWLDAGVLDELDTGALAAVHMTGAILSNSADKLWSAEGAGDTGAQEAQEGTGIGEEAGQ